MESEFYTMNQILILLEILAPFVIKEFLAHHRNHESGKALNDFLLKAQCKCAVHRVMFVMYVDIG